MSLKAFHIIFALLVGAFLVSFGVWCIEQFKIAGSIGMLVTGLSSIFLGVLSAFYLKWFLKKLKGIGLVAFLLGIFLSQTVQACPVCLGDANSPLVASTNRGVFFYLP